MKKQVHPFLINQNSSIKETMKAIDWGGCGIAFIVDKNNVLFGVATDGDIRRAILKGVNIKKKIKEIANKKPLTIKENFTEKDINILKNTDAFQDKILSGLLYIPVVNKKRQVKDMVSVYVGDKRKLKLYKKTTNKRTIKKILITGGSGYLGSVLCRKFLSKGYKIRVFDNLTYGDDGIQELYRNRDFELIKGDIRDISKIISAINGVDAVVHLAAIVGDPACQMSPSKTIEINYLAAKVIAEACKFNQINKFLFASTCSVYGVISDVKSSFTEDSSTNPISLYAETKLKSEEGILSLADENFSPTVFRFATLYGVSSRMRFDLVINLLIAKAILDKKFTVFGGDQWRPNIEVSDAAEACLKWIDFPLQKTGGEIFNVGSNEQNYQIIQIGKIVNRIIPNAKMEIKKDMKDIRNYRVCFDKILKVLNFKPEKDIGQAVIEIRDLLLTKRIKNYHLSRYYNDRVISGDRKV